jgi:hypothetical protein
MGAIEGKRKADAIDLTGDSDDASPSTPHPRKQAKTQQPTPGQSQNSKSSSQRHATQIGGTSVYQTPGPSRGGWRMPTPPTSSSQAQSQVPMSQAPSSTSPFDDEEEVDAGRDYENVTLYGTVNGESNPDVHIICIIAKS